jgi:hypothetical protein
MDYNVALQEARTRFDKWLFDSSVHISPNLREIIYKYGMLRHLGHSHYEIFSIVDIV